MTLNVYLSGEIHTDWRDQIIEGAKDDEEHGEHDDHEDDDHDHDDHDHDDHDHDDEVGDD